MPLPERRVSRPKFKLRALQVRVTIDEDAQVRAWMRRDGVRSKSDVLRALIDLRRRVEHDERTQAAQEVAS